MDILGEGRYRRYDESTARYLLTTMRLLFARYHGKVTEMLASAKDVDKAKRRLQQFKGVGPKTALVEALVRSMPANECPRGDPAP